jgi:hypothetical protein
MAYSKKEIESIFKTICKRIENGEALRTILLEKTMPSSQTFYKWVDNDEIKSKQYARVAELRAENIFEDILTIADNQEEDIYIDDEGKEQTNHNVIQRARLRVDSRKWMLGKMQPKKYGDKNTTVFEGGDKPIEISFED